MFEVINHLGWPQVIVKGLMICGPGKFDWVLVVLLVDCQPWEICSQSWVVTGNGRAGCWCVVGTGQCSGQEWKDAGHAVRGVGRELVQLLVPEQDMMPMEGIWYPECVIAMFVVE